ncbi:MAG: GNAT family N-acetyltransferase [Candidatus Pacearchaeota archaeon]
MSKKINKIRISWSEVEEGINFLVKKIKSPKLKFDGIYGVPRGGLIIAVCLSHSLNLPVLFYPTKNTFVVDDLSDNGFTLQRIKNRKIATLYSADWTITKQDWFFKKKKIKKIGLFFLGKQKKRRSVIAKMNDKKEILIREAKFSDAKKVAEMIKEDLERKNFLYTLNNKPWSEEKIKGIDEQYKNKEGIFVLAFDKKTKKVVGSVSFTYKEEGRIRHIGGCAWFVHPDYQGRGIGTTPLKEIIKKAKKIGLKRLEAEAVGTNKPSWELALKCGFKIEGKKKKAFLTDDGKYINLYVLGRVL